jgi:hypothetical protein
MSAVLVEEGPDKGAIWHFAQPNHEQRALFAGTAWADLSHRGIISITGADRLTWLHALTTQHLEKLAPGQWTDALILDPNGRIEDQLYLVDDGTTTFIHTEADRVEPLLAYLEKMKYMLRVDVKDERGNFSLLRAPGLPDQFGGPYAIVPQNEVADVISAFNQSNMQIGTWALEAERVAAGRPRLLMDIDYKTIPNEIGVLNKAVHMNKGCYRGQETVAKVFNLGAPPRRLVLLHLDGSIVTMPNHGDEITFDGKVVGTIGSVARHYELGPIALALIKRTVPVDAVLDSVGVSATQEALV